MTEFELATQLGEYLLMEVDDVNSVEYSKENTEPTEFAVVMENGKKFSVKIQRM